MRRAVEMTDQSTYRVRPVTPSDLRSVARVHSLAFPRSALTILGVGAVRRYYDWQLRGPHDVTALCIAEGSELTAFCFGGTFRGALSGFLKKNRRYLLWCVVTRPWVLMSEVVRQQINTAIQSLSPRYRSWKKPPPPSVPMLRSATFGVLAIAVHPSKLGTGQGKCLMQCLEATARQRHFPGMHLTVSPENRTAIDFYERLGWSRIPAGGVWAGLMRKNLSS